MSRAVELEAQGFVAVCQKSEIPGMLPKRVEIEGRGVLIIRQLMRVRAVDEACPHRGFSMAQGLVLGPELMCPVHRYGFDIVTGECRTHPSCPPVSVHEVEVVEGTVYVRVDDAGGA